VKSAIAHCVPATEAVRSDLARIPATALAARCRPDRYACTSAGLFTAVGVLAPVGVLALVGVLSADGLAAAAGAPTRDPPRKPADSVPATIRPRARRLIRLPQKHVTIPFPSASRKPWVS
jgi:hypothetical protein